jgi:hypothetical protein
VQAVAGQLAGCDVGPDLARLGAGGEQIGDQVLELLPRPGHVLAAVQQRYRQFGVVVLVLDQRECHQDGFELPGRSAGGGILRSEARKLGTVRSTVWTLAAGFVLIGRRDA